MPIIGISPVPAVSRTADTLQMQLPAYLTNQGPGQARPVATPTRYPLDRLGRIVNDATLTAEQKIALVGGLCIQTLLDQGHSVAYAAARISVTESEALDLSVDCIAYETGWLRGVGLRPETDQSNR